MFYKGMGSVSGWGLHVLESLLVCVVRKARFTEMCCQC